MVNYLWYAQGQSKISSKEVTQKLRVIFFVRDTLS